jgi:hypothetical protein
LMGVKLRRGKLGFQSKHRVFELILPERVAAE